MLQTMEFTLPELLKRWGAGQIPMNAMVQVTFDPATVSTEDEAGKDVTLALFEQWALEDAQMSAEELEADRRLYEQFEHNVNETRRASGMRTL